MSRDEKGEELSDRMSKRFEDETDNLDNIDNTDNSDNGDSQEKSVNPKEDWTGRMVYVPDSNSGGVDLLNAFDGEYDRLQYECDWKIRKQLHYYPVVVQHGVDAVADMDGDEFTEAVEALELR